MIRHDLHGEQIHAHLGALPGYQFLESFGNVVR
jgi:hypothetical protein